MYEAAEIPAADMPVPGIREYLREPTATLASGSRRRGPEFVRLLGLCFLIALASGPLSAILSTVAKADNRLDDISPVAVAVLGVLVAPVLEELTFRLNLAPFHPWWLVLSALGLAAVDFRLGAAALVLTIAVLAIPAWRRATRRLWREHFPVVFFASAILFGMVHATNWKLGRPSLALVVLPLLVLPQALIGVVLGYTRVRMGLRWSMLLHGSYNGAVLGLAALLTLGAHGH